VVPVAAVCGRVIPGIEPGRHAIAYVGPDKRREWRLRFGRLRYGAGRELRNGHGRERDNGRVVHVGIGPPVRLVFIRPGLRRERDEIRAIVGMERAEPTARPAPSGLGGLAVITDHGAEVGHRLRSGLGGLVVIVGPEIETVRPSGDMHDLGPELAARAIARGPVKPSPPVGFRECNRLVNSGPGDQVI
jgi:hypothetical protein